MRLLIAACTVLFLVGCAKQMSPTARANTSAKQLALQKAEQLMQLSEESAAQEAINYKLQAIEQLVAADHIEQAQYAIYEEIKDKLDENNRAYKQIILAQIELAKRNLTDARQHLREIWTPAKLPEDLLLKFYQTRAEIYRRSGKLIDSVQERIYLAKHLKSQPQKDANNNEIWDTLLQLTPATLKAMPRDHAKSELNGWLEFAAISKQYDASPQDLLNALNKWQVQYAHHPAINFMPGNGIAISRTTTNEQPSEEPTQIKRVIATPKKIALLLPLQGPHSKSAHAIRDGFLAAFYAHKDDPNKPMIEVHDTTAQHLVSLYRDVVDKGTDFIVGPLTKDEVDIISGNIQSDVPMLALNNSSRVSSHDNILQFSLSPETEAQAVAVKAWHDGHRNAAIITPKSAWGRRMLHAFEKAWLELGGAIISREEIGSQAELTSRVKRLLAIDMSEARAQKLKQSGLKFAFDPRRREDIDMIFIGTNAAMARQVKPLLNFYFATNIPAYASSSVYSGRAQPALDHDLNGIQFCDMPWILDKSIALGGTHRPTEDLWQSEFDQYARLYALGLDAYKIALQIEQLTMMPNLGISGMTGMLTLQQGQSIDRKLMWASFKKGAPQVSGDQL